MRKKKKKRFSAVKTVKAISRERIGVVPGGKVIPDPRLKPPKYPKKDLLSEE